jgi:glycosyltransferase involved in cell wall biosynthesis
VLPRTLPRVLYAINMDPTVKLGSLEEEIISLAQVFKEQGSVFVPLFIGPEETGGSNFCKAFGIESECLDLRSFSWPRLLRLSQLISRHKISHVHWNFTEMLRNGYLWGLSFLRPNVGHLYTDHNSRIFGSTQPSGWLKRVVKRSLLHRYEKVFCVSQFVLDNLQRQQTFSNLILSRHFVNTERFRPDRVVRDEYRKRFNVEPCFVVLTVAHLIKEKGIDVMIRALAELPSNVVLWIVGDGEESENLKQLSCALHLASRVYFHGHQKNVAPFMKAADCFVCPSLWAEAAGLVNLEATSSGLPVIASRTGGISEYIENGRTGFLFLPGDHRELARLLLLVQKDPVLRREMGEQARAHAVDKFRADAAGCESVELYRSSEPATGPLF